MQLAALIGCVFVLAAITVQDFRSRMLVWWLLPLLLIGLLIFSLEQNTFTELVPHFLINLAFVALQLLLLMLWFSLRNRRFVRLIDTHIGLGDVLLLVCLCVVFSPINFILFVTSGLILTVLGVVAVRVVRKETSPLIPLAGLLAIPLAICSVSAWLLKLNLHDDSWLLPLLEPAY